MANCRRCQAPIQWRQEGARWIRHNPDGSLHATTCTAEAACRLCERPIVWQEHAGKRLCFEPDGKTPHNDVCPCRDQCNHCGQKIRWLLVEKAWLAFSPGSSSELHWAVCPKNPEAAKALLARLASLTAENENLRGLLVKSQREINYRDVELRRLTAALETGKRKSG